VGVFCITASAVKSSFSWPDKPGSNLALKHVSDTAYRLYVIGIMRARSELDLSRLRSGLSVHLGGLSFECQGAFVPQC